MITYLIIYTEQERTRWEERPSLTAAQNLWQTLTKEQKHKAECYTMEPLDKYELRRITLR